MEDGRDGPPSSPPALLSDAPPPPLRGVEISSSTLFWIGLLMGLGITATVAMALVLSRRKGVEGASPFSGVGGATYHILNQAPHGVSIGGTPLPAQLAAPPPAPHPGYPKNGSVARSVTLSTDAAGLFFADQDVKLTVACVGPAGAFAFVGIDSPLTDDTSGIFIPAGDRRPLTMRMGQRLYGRGSVDGVLISISG